MEEKKCSFSQALTYIVKWTGIEANLGLKIKYPFGGFYKNLKNDSATSLSLETYSEKDLPSPLLLSKKFLDDGVALTIQEQFGVRYDPEEDKILIPIKDYVGNICGVKARNNNPNCRYDDRWSMYIPYPKSQVVYGWYENYQKIVNKKTVVIFEAEKSTLQANSFGCFVSVAIGGHNISNIQAQYIKSLFADNVILAYDEGLEEELLRYEAKKLVVDNIITHNKVGYIYDKNHSLLKIGSKDSPSDNGRQIFKQLTKDCVVWLA